MSVEEIQESKNVKISSCRYCNRTYEPGSTFCLECGESFWKEILGGQKPFFHNLFRRFRRRRTETLHAPLIFPQDSEEYADISLEEEIDLLPIEDKEIDSALEMLETFKASDEPSSQREKEIPESTSEGEKPAEAIQPEELPEVIPEGNPSVSEEILPTIGIEVVHTEEKAQEFHEEKESFEKGTVSGSEVEAKAQVVLMDADPEKISNLEDAEVSSPVTRMDTDPMLEAIEVLMEGWPLEDANQEDPKSLQQAQETTGIYEDDETVFAVPDFDFRPQISSSDLGGSLLVDDKEPAEIEVSEMILETELIPSKEEDLIQETLPEAELVAESLIEPAAEQALPDVTPGLGQLEVDQNGDLNLPTREETQEEPLPEEAFEFTMSDPSDEFSEENPALALLDVETGSKKDFGSNLQENLSTVEKIIPQILEEDLKEELVLPVLGPLAHNGSKKGEPPLATIRDDFLMKDSGEEDSFT
ncbi:MAG: hypothetical protein L0Y56_15470, partial [Nitrospira sp.]|nr:hypothetical protein [Nitrospira sp.]